MQRKKHERGLSQLSLSFFQEKFDLFKKQEHFPIEMAYSTNTWKKRHYDKTHQDKTNHRHHRCTSIYPIKLFTLQQMD